jgi:lipopolysaccharide transport system permease protein
MFSALWNYRVFVISSIRNEFENRFSRSKLGGLWMIINPLVQVVIFAMVLSNLLSARLPGINNENAYALYLMSGTLSWGLFSEIVSRSLNLFIEQAGVMKKIQFPRITLPTILIGSALLNNMLLFASILVIFALLGHMPNISVLWVPLLTLIVMVMAAGIGLILGIFNVFLRDLAQIVPVFLQIVYWLTPIVYPASVIPKQYQMYLEYNPMYPLVAAYQNVLVFGVSPDWVPLLKLLALSAILLMLGLFLFRKASPEIVDVL